MLIPTNLQLFAEDESGEEEELLTTPDKDLERAARAATEQIRQQAKQTPAGKTYSEDYVHTIREEAKNNRIARKNAELRLKDLIGLGVDDDLDDAKILAYKTAQEAEKGLALRKANDRLIQAEIKGLEGYDAKLVGRLIDKSKLTIEEDGTVKGLPEAVAELEKDFPQIKSTQTKQQGGTNPGFQTNLTGLEALQAQLLEAQKKGKLAEVIALKNKIFEEQRK